MPNENAPVTTEAWEYIQKLFPCEKPCDSYGICEGCFQAAIFQAGYNFGFRAGKNFLKGPEEPKEK